MQQQVQSTPTPDLPPVTAVLRYAVCCVLCAALSHREKYDEGQLLQAVQDTVHELLQPQQQQEQQQQQQQQQQTFPGLAEFTVYEQHDGQADKHYCFLWELLPSSTAHQHTVHSQRPPSAAAAAADAAAADDADLIAAAAAAAGGPGCVSPATLAAWSAALNRNLAQHNTVYGQLLSVGQVGPATIQLVTPGSFQALKESLVAAKGISPSQFKMPTVVAAVSDYAAYLRKHAVQ